MKLSHDWLLFKAAGNALTPAKQLRLMFTDLLQLLRNVL